MPENNSKKEKPLKFRNYVPQDEKLQQYKLSRAEIPDLTEKIEKNLAIIANKEPELNDLSLAPKKVNWDLKRDIKSKLDKLEIRTQRAVIEMMREKLQTQSNQQEDLNQGYANHASKAVEDSESEGED